MKPRWLTNAVEWDISTLDFLNRLQYYRDTEWKECNEETTNRFLRRSLCLRTDVVRQLAGPGRTYPERYRRFTGGSLDRPQNAGIRIPPTSSTTGSRIILSRTGRGNAPPSISVNRRTNSNGILTSLVTCTNPVSSRSKSSRYGVSSGIRENRTPHNMEAHEKLFHLLTKNWRENWAEELPFYYVQLSSIDRPSWPWFRDSQRRMLQSIPQQRHGGQQRPWRLPGCPPAPQTGDRGTPRSLGTQQDIRARDPSFRSTLPIGDIQGDSTAYVTFDYGKGMHSSDGDKLRTFEIAEHDGLFVPAEAQIIDGKTVKVWSGQIRIEIRPLRLATFHPCQFSERSGVAGFDIPFGSGSGQLVSAA